MSENDWVEPALWYGTLPTVHVAGLGLIRDDLGRVLLVKPGYRAHWTLPGGMSEANEPPDVTVVRELQEELGLGVSPGLLAVVDWAPPQGDRQRPLLAFVFAVETTRADQEIELDTSELEDWAYVRVDDMNSRMSERSVNRIRMAVRAADMRTSALLVDGSLATPGPGTCRPDADGAR